MPISIEEASDGLYFSVDEGKAIVPACPNKKLGQHFEGVFFSDRMNCNHRKAM